MNKTSNSACAWSLATLARWLKGKVATERASDSWNKVWEWGARHRCTGILLRAVAGAHWLGEKDRLTLKKETFALNVRAMCQVVECRRIEAQLRQRNIPAHFFKGVALGDQLYGNAAVRTGGDIDLLVDVEDTPQALACLIELDYAPLGPSIDQVRRGWKAFRKFDNHFTLWNPERGALVELHWRLFREHWSLESTIRDSLCKKRFRRTSCEISPSLRPALYFVYLVEHGAKHDFYAVQWLVDVVVQWRRLSNKEKSEARRLVIKHALERKLSLAGEMATKLLDLDTRDEGWPGCPPTPRSVIDFALQRFFADDPLANIDSAWHLRNLRCQLALSGKWRERASFLLFSTVTTPTLLRLQLPSALAFLYPFLRLLFLLARIAGMRPQPIRVPTSQSPLIERTRWHEPNRKI
jgi:hypothetical protein